MVQSPCPYCANPITLMQLALAASPWHLKCRQCQRPVGLKGWALAIFGVYVVVAVALIALIVFIYITERTIPRVSIPISMLIIGGVGLIIEALLLAAHPFKP
ncbi:MAG: hypothetical protein H0T53_10210 [Herpetosiphonaceae bacterium]|nr:hypothetical protein [Herpetosiphonaceae bacterium]